MKPFVLLITSSFFSYQSCNGALVIRMESSIEPPGIDPETFSSILQRECNTELRMLNMLLGPHAVNKAWYTPSERLWHESKSVETFIVCDESPFLSGNRRRQNLDKVLSECQENEAYNQKSSSAVAESNGSFLHNEILFNNDTRTCFYVSSTSIVAECISRHGPVAFALNQSDYKDVQRAIYRVQPLLPMMKVAQNTIATVRSMKYDESAVTLLLEIKSTITARNETGIQRLVYNLVAGINTRNHTVASMQLKETFPFTSIKFENGLPDSTDHTFASLLKVEPYDSSEYDEIVYYEAVTFQLYQKRRDPVVSDTSTHDNFRIILSSLAGFAASPQVRYLEILNEDLENK